LVTVEADSAGVEFRLCGGELCCPDCRGVLRPWGWARSREIRDVGSLRPRRARCSGCAVTHVLLPVTVLLRRADGVRVVWAAVLAKAAGRGHRPISAGLGVPASTVRGWLRRMTTRLESVRLHFLQVTRLAGVDVAVPKAAGSAWLDLVAAVAAAAAAAITRFGAVGVLGAVTGWQLVAASSGGRLLAPGWPPVPVFAGRNTSRP
jgi:hypothetical protein